VKRFLEIAPRSAARRAATSLTCVAVMLACAGQAVARQATPPAGPVQGKLPPDQASLKSPSTLGEENLSRVAAAPDDVVKVLQTDPGMMVELKKWVATNATNHGQIVDDEELTDQAIIGKVRSDTEFRGIATRLLQRYGYLLPKFSPGSQAELDEQLRRQSQMAEEKRIEEDRARQTEEAAQVPGNGGYATPTNRGGKYMGPPTDTFGTGAPQQGVSPNLPLQRSPAMAVPLSPGLMRTSSASNEEGDNNQSFRTAAALFGMSPNLGAGLDASQLSALVGSRPSSGTINQELAERGSIANDGQNQNQYQSNYGTYTTDAAGNPVPMNSTQAGIPGNPRGGATQTQMASRLDHAPPVYEHVANPFTNIPSQFDLYQRVSTRPVRLEAFGADVFSEQSQEASQLPTDLPVGPDYVVGPGDGLYIDMTGSTSQRIPRVVDRQGRVDLPEVGAVLVAGKSLGEVQTAVQSALRTQYRNVNADVSLARLRTVRVYMVGEVENKGAYDISSLSTAINALVAAGGPTPNGSLRHVRHMRSGTLVEDVDVYDLLLRGVTGDVKRIESGDTLLIPPAGPRVAVEGMVRRPAIYELRNETNLAQVLELAGGVLPTASLKHIEVERIEAHEKKTILNLEVNTSDEESATKQLENFKVMDGDHVHILSIAPATQDAVYLQGHVQRPGKYSYKDGMKITDLIGSYGDLLPEPDSYAEIVRLSAPDYRPQVESFDLSAALANPAAAPKLAPLDTVQIYSRYDFENVPTILVGGEVRKPGNYQTAGQLHVRDAIFQAGGVTQDASTESAQLVRYSPDGSLKISTINLGGALAGEPAANIILQPRDRLIVQRNSSRVDPPGVAIRGEVRNPGHYPLATNLTVADLIGLSGGLKRSAYTGTADITRYISADQSKVTGEHVTVDIAKAMSGDPANNLTLNDGDVLTISKVAGWEDRGASVSIAGEVTHPGMYGIKPGERLSSLLKRAGYLLPTAYPQGSIFERAEVRSLQQKSVNDMIARMEQQNADVKVSLGSSAGEAIALSQAAAAQRDRTVAALKSAPITGRMVVHIPSDLKNFVGSTEDIQLRAGDTLFIPKRPEFVIVSGQVYNANALTWQPRKTVGWYLSRAGGITSLGEKKGIFVIRADGSVISGRGTDWWGRNVMSVRINPGDNIVVPEKPLGGSTFWRNFMGIAQIVESGAIATSALRSAGL
jgi:polysaccharide biosynthesis/export protein